MSRICDFCDKTEFEVKKLIEGKNRQRAMHICDECVVLSMDIIIAADSMTNDSTVEERK